jgi:NTP pyrophosphatase (non-canonical NTP hydrolase)
MSNLLDYQDFVATVAKSCATEEVDGQTMNVLHWSLGLSGEVGELVDTVKKHVFYKQPFDIVNAQEELGDIVFYVAAMCEELGLTLDYVIANNKAKLMQRYPTGYSDELASKRLDKGVDNVEGC